MNGIGSDILLARLIDVMIHRLVRYGGGWLLSVSRLAALDHDSLLIGRRRQLHISVNRIILTQADDLNGI